MSYPKSMQMMVSRLAGFSKNGVKLRPMSQESAKAGDVIVFELPTNTPVDLRTFSILTRGATTGATGANNCVSFPKHIESLIESVQVEINGTLIDTGFLRYNHLHKTYMDYFCGVDKASTLRNLLQYTTQPDASTVAVETNKLLCFNTFLGFLSAKCPVIDTSILGQVRVLVRLASNDVLVTRGVTSNPSYTLNNLFATIDTIAINDGMYYDMIQQRLAEAPIEVMFDRYYVFENGSTSGAQNTRWAVSTQSLDWVIGTLLTNVSRTTPNVFNAITGTSEYFTRSGRGITDSLFYFNNVQYPNYSPRMDDGSILCETLQNLNVLSDLVGGGDSGLTTYTNWERHFWCHVHRFNHLPDAGDDNRLISGLNTLGANAQGSWVTTGASLDNATVGAAAASWPLVYVKTTATLAIGAGRMLEVRA
jgi:hypothetical protein